MSGCRAAILLLTVWSAFSSCSPPKEDQEAESEPVVSVEAVHAVERTITEKVSAEGVLYPLQQAAIVPKISAPVRAFHVEKGSAVRAGQLLAELESRDLTNAVAESQAALEQAEANYQTTSRVAVPQEAQKAELDVRAAKDVLDTQQKRYDSLQDLYRQGAIAQKEVNEAAVVLTQARNQYEIAQRVLQDLQTFGRDQTLKAAIAQREAARVRLDATQTQLSYARITSPISGIVTDRPLYSGETAASGAPLLTVMDLSSVIARVHVSQEKAAEIKVGYAAALQVSDGGDSVPGKVIQISPALDPGSTTVEVWVQAANPGMRLRAGMSTHVEITVRTQRNAIVIPESAVVTDESGEKSVILIGEGNQPAMQPVELGIHEGTGVQVTKGLKAGDRVVSVGAYELSKLEPDVLKETRLEIQPSEEEKEHEEN